MCRAECRCAKQSVLIQSYMSSAGLRCLLMAQKTMTAAGGEVRIKGVQPVVKEVLDITGFSDIFTLV